MSECGPRSIMCVPVFILKKEIWDASLANAGGGTKNGTKFKVPRGCDKSLNFLKFLQVTRPLEFMIFNFRSSGQHDSELCPIILVVLL